MRTKGHGDLTGKGIWEGDLLVMSKLFLPISAVEMAFDLVRVVKEIFAVESTGSVLDTPVETIQNDS
jgi:hypothetical protein